MGPSLTTVHSNSPTLKRYQPGTCVPTVGAAAGAGDPVKAPPRTAPAPTSTCRRDGSRPWFGITAFLRVRIHLARNLRGFSDRPSEGGEAVDKKARSAQ